MGMSESDTFLNVKRVPAEVTRDEAASGMRPATRRRDWSGIDSMASSTFPGEDAFDALVVGLDTFQAKYSGMIGGNCRYVLPRPASGLADRP